jgi:hypothetical protein
MSLILYNSAGNKQFSISFCQRQASNFRVGMIHLHERISLLHKVFPSNCGLTECHL